jgi:hypothetical protein
MQIQANTVGEIDPIHWQPSWQAAQSEATQYCNR